MQVVATGGDELAVNDEEDGFGCGMVGGTGFICQGMEEQQCLPLHPQNKLSLWR